MFICIFSHFIYGHSGTELPPPVTETRRYVAHSLPGERLDEFRARMTELGLAGRQRLSEKPRKPYSSKDGLDWQIITDQGLEEFDLALLDKTQ